MMHDPFQSIPGKGSNQMRRTCPLCPLIEVGLDMKNIAASDILRDFVVVVIQQPAFTQGFMLTKLCWKTSE